MQYSGDYDETLPMSRYSDSGDSGGSRANPYTVSIHPYVKNFGVYKCPSDPSPAPNASAEAWCRGIVGTRDTINRSYVPVAWHQGRGGAKPGAVMSAGFGAAIASIVSPAGTVMVAERYEGSRFCQAGSVHYHGTGDFIDSSGATGTGAGWQSAAGVVQVVSPVAILRNRAGGFAPGTTNPLTQDVFAGRYHQGGMNLIFCDGHAKWTKWQNTFQRDPANPNRLLWTMWDRRIGKQ